MVQIPSRKKKAQKGNEKEKRTQKRGIERKWEKGQLEKENQRREFPDCSQPGIETGVYDHDARFANTPAPELRKDDVRPLPAMDPEDRNPAT